ncbi:MAG: hypothetical protein ACOYL3_23950 [Desulfuromonadaceae bacterium]
MKMVLLAVVLFVLTGCSSIHVVADSHEIPRKATLEVSLFEQFENVSLTGPYSKKEAEIIIRRALEKALQQAGIQIVKDDEDAMNVVFRLVPDAQAPVIISAYFQNCLVYQYERQSPWYGQPSPEQWAVFWIRTGTLNDAFKGLKNKLPTTVQSNG